MDVDFSMAMYNRTGKYFIGRDLIDCAADLLGTIYYGRVAAAAPPTGLYAKLLCRVLGTSIRINTAGGVFGHQIRRDPPRPLLHLEPYTVLGSRLRRCDAVVVHDVGPITHPELFEQRLYPTYQQIFAEIDAIGPHLIFVSEASRVAFEQTYPNARPASVHVLYPAIRLDIVERTHQPVQGVTEPFLLTTGSIGDRKNQARAIAAFGRSGLAERGVTYVLCGAEEPGHEAVSAAAASTPGVRLLSYVTDAELAWLYDHARGFVLPSLLEGFGIPLAEAIDCGAVPLVTADSVLEEVAGEGAITCDALSEESIAAGMVALVDMDQNEREDRLHQLRGAIARFTPERFCTSWRAALIAIDRANRRDGRSGSRDVPPSR